jgi:hypothetical protein
VCSPPQYQSAKTPLALARPSVPPPDAKFCKQASAILSLSQLAMSSHRKQPQLAKRRGTLTHRTHTQLTGEFLTPDASLLGRYLATLPLTQLCFAPTETFNSHRRDKPLPTCPFKARFATDALTALPVLTGVATLASQRATPSPQHLQTLMDLCGPAAKSTTLPLALGLPTRTAHGLPTL